MFPNVSHRCSQPYSACSKASGPADQPSVFESQPSQSSAMAKAPGIATLGTFWNRWDIEQNNDATAAIVRFQHLAVASKVSHKDAVSTSADKSVFESEPQQSKARHCPAKVMVRSKFEIS